MIFKRTLLAIVVFMKFCLFGELEKIPTKSMLESSEENFCEFFIILICTPLSCLLLVK